MRIRTRQLLKLYNQSWPKAVKAKAEQRATGSKAAGDRAAYYVIQWLKIKKIAMLES